MARQPSTAPNAESGPYQGTSLVWFPATSGSLLVLVVGTEGFGADQELLGRPGHARRLRALGRVHGSRLWVKPDLLDLQFKIAEAQWEQWPDLDAARSQYGSFIYSAAFVNDAVKNRALVEDLRRLGLGVSVQSSREPAVALTPGARIGAIPLLAASTHRVVAGLLIEPRFKWQSLGAIYRSIGFEVAPNVGGGVLVPGSARHVPPWLLAAPVIARIEALLEQRKRSFIEVHSERGSPRGRVDWNTWVRSNVPNGRWTTFPCGYPEPSLDPLLAANIRWTTKRLREELGHASELEVGRALLSRLDGVDLDVGDGPLTRPVAQRGARDAASVLEALEAMGWVADERGLGGAVVLDGLAWDVSVDAVWEAWVRRFVADLGPRLGLRDGGDRARQIALRWHGAAHSMRKLKPDASLVSADRTIWFDAKYKPHLSHLQRGAGLAQVRTFRPNTGQTFTRRLRTRHAARPLRSTPCSSTPRSAPMFLESRAPGSRTASVDRASFWARCLLASEAPTTVNKRFVRGARRLSVTIRRMVDVPAPRDALVQVGGRDKERPMRSSHGRLGSQQPRCSKRCRGFHLNFDAERIERCDDCAALMTKAFDDLDAATLLLSLDDQFVCRRHHRRAGHHAALARAQHARSASPFGLRSAEFAPRRFMRA